jgi:predicted nucleic-acid-binding Zn-ribbon protein
MFNLLYIITGNYNIRVFKTHSQSFLAILKRNCSPSTLYLSSQSFRTLENRSDCAEIYMHVSIGQSRGKRK